MIRHTVVFCLRHVKGSQAEQDFLTIADVLTKIPGVMKFEKLRQTSIKNDYDYGFSMEFENQTTYDGYTFHPLHVAFVNDHWIPEVSRFMEIDYVAL
jgi:hypothetical protein